jgi:hypothetical protein
MSLQGNWLNSIGKRRFGEVGSKDTGDPAGRAWQAGHAGDESVNLAL